ncbi:hypothetical protein ACGFKX_15645 [Pseudonocardia alni]|uniref:aggregation-promoting factor C-terminal-like domain-containing protein n=1 Tax=Pseudonocardia alni TaxID=33907 RepID=UPI003713E63A
MQILPSLRGFQKKVTAGVKATRAPDINVKINVDRKSLAEAETAARKAADKVASARRIEQGATDKASASERNLEEARKRGEHTASALAIMERRVAREKEAASRASRGAAKAAADEERAVRRVAAAQAQLDKSLSSNRRRTRVEVDSSSLLRATIHARRLKSELGGLAKAGALAGAGIAAVGAGGAALAALPAVIGSVTAGVGVLGFSLSGVGEALKGYQADQEAAAGASASTAASALSDARTLKSAQAAIDDAKRNSVRVARTGAEQIQAASERVTDAVANERRAQADLAQSYKDARRELTDLRDAQAGYASSVEGAQIALLRQQERYREVMGDAASTALDRREAEYELVEAQLRVRDATKAQVRSAEELRDSERKGVAGSDQVVAARERLVDAQDQVRESRVDLQRTERDAAEANQDAARAVADAVNNLTDTQAAQAASAAGAAGATSKFAEAMAKLTPEAQALVRQLVSMGPLIDRLKSAAGKDFLPGVTQMLKDSEGLFPIFETNLQRTGKIMGDTAADFGRLFKSDEFKKNLDQMLRNSEPVTKAIGSLFLSITDSLVTMGAKTSQTQSGFADFTDSLNTGLQRFFDKLSTPQADKAFGELWRELGDLLKFLLPKLADLAVWAAEKVGPAIGALTDFLTRNKDRLGEWAFAIGVAIGVIKGLNIVKSVVGWADGIAGAFRIIRGDADKVSDSVGRDGKSGVRGRLAALKAIGKIGITIAATYIGFEFLKGLMDGGEGKRRIDVNVDGKLSNTEGWNALSNGDIQGLGSAAGQDSKKAVTNSGKQFSQGNAAQGVWQFLNAGDSGGPGGAVAKWLDDLNRTMTDGAGKIRDNVSGKFRELRDNATSRTAELKSNVSGWWNTTKTDVTNRASELATNAGTKLRELRDGASARASETWSNVSGWWNTTKTDVSNRASELASNAGTKLRELRDGASARASETWSNVSGWWNRTKTDVGNRASELATNAGTKLRELRDGASARASETWSNVSGWWNRTSADVGTKARELKDNAVARATELRDAFGDRIRTLVDNVGRKWDELKGFFARPIKWVIDYVWNGTIANLWGKARELIPALPEFKRLAAGGEVRGPGTATSDSIPAMLSNGEFVLSASDVKRLGGFAGVEKMRRNARAGLPAYADGGPVTWQELQRVVLGQFPTARITDTTRPGARDLHGAGKAIDIAGPRPMDMPFMLNVNRWIASNYGNAAELIHTPGINLKNGKPHRYNDAVRASHYNHVHFANNGGGILDALKRFGGGVWDTVSTYFRDAMAGIFDGPANAIRGLLGNMFPGDTLANRIPKDGGNQILDGVRDFLFGKADSEDAAGGGGGIAAGGTGPVADQVRAVARRFGWGEGGQWNAIVKLLGGESSWNPTIKNPTSSAHGLFQFLDATWATVGGRKTSNPGEQAEYGFRYIKQRYGDPMGAYRTWLSRSPHWYDNGGYLMPGRTSVVNATGKPEAVLTDSQWNVASAAVRQVTSGHGLDRITGSGPSTVHKTGVRIDQFTVRETVDVDRVLDRAAFQMGRFH